MLKAVVFDDEPIVLTGLMKKIDWGRFGIELAGTARDGLSALRLARRIQPHIVLTDIRMPGMNGLELIEKLSAELSNTMFIVFSGYNEFEYVRRAIGLGVVDYLEKPITMTKVEKAIARTLEIIGKEQAFSELKVKWEESREERLEMATLELLLIGEEATARWKETFGEGSSRLSAVTVFAFECAGPPLPEHPLYREIKVRNGNEYLSVVFHAEKRSPALEEQLNHWDNRVLYGSGRTYASLGEAKRSYREAIRALRYGKFLEESGRVRIEDVEGKESKGYVDLQQHEEAIIVSLRTGDKEGLEWALNGFRAWTKERRLTPERVEEELLKLVFLCVDIARETGRDMTSLGIVRHRELHELDALDRMFDWMRGKLEELVAWTTSARREMKHASLERILDYMEERYAQDLSLQELADLAELHPAYLSLLFKERLGVSYRKYLTGIRMEKAKALLREGERVHEVYGKVGYVNQRHFAETFKRAVGMTPGHYRDLHAAGRRYANDEDV
ncbi:response regulator [Cohnella thailandensis]|uniref:Response regulator n=1 Tax=Cohnella thailandensis TaxID=557557 RepID=A0A841STQ3_9BACL|nr:response regulator [Cohnella thailandensis]MBB6634612.1 response regulator [Cohnella thailandensis]MBP1972832.1 two-component system response regulator YesN [Cohnella thailandensis]